MTAASLFYLFAMIYVLRWRWKRPGSVSVKIAWTCFCIVVPLGALFLIEISRPAEPIRRLADCEGGLDNLPPGNELSVFSVFAILIAVMMFVIVFSVDMGIKVHADTSGWGWAAALIMFIGIYGLLRARTIIERGVRT